MIPPLFEHQIADIATILAHPNATLNFSDPGTGKTRTTLEVIRRRRAEGRTLVICPKAIMAPAWGEDIKKFTPELSYAIADAQHREDPFAKSCDIVIINHDGVNWLAAHPEVLTNFCQLIVDEATAFRNDSKRSKALHKIQNAFKYRIVMTGTPYTNTILDVWRQSYIADNGQRLGKSFYRFRDQVCQSRQLGNGITVWEDRPNMEPIVYHLLNDICIRHKLEDCTDLPENITHTIDVTLNKKHLALYKELENTTLLQLANNVVTSANAAVLANKLLQLASGAVYDNFGQYHILDTDRYELVKELALARSQCIIAYNWKHQREQLRYYLKDAEVIDGDTPNLRRADLIQRFQSHQIPQLIIHPKTGAHGLTLTAGTATIWASPTYSAELFTQFNRRIYRAGQTQKTETLLIAAKNTIEEHVYQRLNDKLQNANAFITLFELLNPEATP